MTREKKIYVENLAARMRSAGQHNWTYSDMADLCELADLFDWWLSTVTRKEEETITLKAAKALGVEIQHYIPTTKAVEFFRTTTGIIGKVNGVTVWFIRHEAKEFIKNGEEWFVYQSADGGETFKLIPAECVENADGSVDWEQPHTFGFTTKQAAKAFVYNQELKGVA